MNTVTRQTLSNRNTPMTWMVILICFFYFVPSLLMDRIWIHLETVEVSPLNLVGEPITMVVHREVLREFRGYFTVDIRRTNGELIYSADSEGTFIYGPGKKLPEPLLLTWWMGGQKQMAEARARGFDTGSYYIDTCHTVVLGIWDIPVARRCVQSNIFQVIDEKDLL
jgi:hypothetical protein